MIVKIIRLAPMPIRLIWWQAGKVARINCTGFTCEVAETNLPFTPAITPVNLAQGEFDIVPPTLVEAAELEIDKSYTLAIRLLNAGGQPVQFMRATVGVE